MKVLHPPNMGYNPKKMKVVGSHGSYYWSLFAKKKSHHLSKGSQSRKSFHWTEDVKPNHNTHTNVPTKVVIWPSNLRDLKKLIYVSKGKVLYIKQGAFEEPQNGGYHLPKQKAV